MGVFLCRLLTHSNIKMKTVILAVVVITIWCSLSVVQSRPDGRDPVEHAIHKHKIPAEESQKKTKNIVEKADLDDYDYSASSKTIKRINVPDDGPGAAYGYVAAGAIRVAGAYPY